MFFALIGIGMFTLESNRFLAHTLTCMGLACGLVAVLLGEYCRSEEKKKEKEK